MVCRPDEQKRFTDTPAVVTGQPARKRDLTRHVRARRALQEVAPTIDVLDFGRVDARALDRLLEHVAGERDGVRHVERTAP